MRIPNKFNGYRFDGTRNLHDPVTAAGLMAAGGGELGSAALAAGATDALTTGIVAGSTIAGGGIASLLGGFGADAAAANLSASGLGGAMANVAPAATSQLAGTIGTETALNPTLEGIAKANPELDFSKLATTNPAGNPEYIQQLTAGDTVAPNVVNPISSATPTSPYDLSSGMQSNVGLQPPGAPGTGSPLAPSLDATKVIQPGANFLENAGNLIQNPSMQAAKDYALAHPYATSAGVGMAAKALFSQPTMSGGTKGPPAMIRPYDLNVTNTSGQAPQPGDSSERQQLMYNFTPQAPYAASLNKAEGGIANAYAVGGPVETMSAQNAVGANQMYPQAGLQTSMYSNPETQRPMSANVLSPESDVAVDPYTGEQKFAMGGGVSSLGSYSDGGHLLKGPGDGVSDSIPAQIGGHQPARLADGEFVVPARIVSELGNGSTEAGARKLYAMMDRVQKARGKTIGKGKVAVDSKSSKHLPA